MVEFWGLCSLRELVLNLVSTEPLYYLCSIESCSTFALNWFVLQARLKASRMKVCLVETVLMKKVICISNSKSSSLRTTSLPKTKSKWVEIQWGKVFFGTLTSNIVFAGNRERARTSNTVYNARGREYWRSWPARVRRESAEIFAL
jgi:hypothetical protein